MVAAIRLQTLYDSIKDYEPTPDYNKRLRELVRDSQEEGDNASEKLPSTRSSAIWRSFGASSRSADSLSLTRTLSRAEVTRNVNSPKGLMLHGEVGTGKSMLIDLFADCLPTEKKARWHYNTFLLHVYAKLEHHRKVGHLAATDGEQNHSIACIAANIVKSSPILFLDEFQLPDRAASKIMTNLMISFFQLGGVLVATSNRMPEELDKAAGIAFAQPPSRLDSIRWRLGVGGRIGRSESMFAGHGEFAEFLDILKSRCDVWEMPGKNDYRRRESMSIAPNDDLHMAATDGQIPADVLTDGSAPESIEEPPRITYDSPSILPVAMPPHYLLQSTLQDAQTTIAQLHGARVTWVPASLRVYGRDVILQRSSGSTVCCSFAELCETTYGPADYITIASAFDTLILLDVPVLTLARKNEARRFITLLDALYEARCKLAMTAEAGPDELFFPDSKDDGEDDAVHPETFSEAYQDVTAPFRPNVSSENAGFVEDSRPDYSHARMQGMLAPDSLEDDPPNRRHRYLDEVDESRRRHSRPPALNFAGTGAFTGEDERFAFKRARSRLWEMTGTRWWARHEPGWHKPVPDSVRGWEKDAAAPSGVFKAKDAGIGTGRALNEEENKVMFRHGASPFRRSNEPPPKFNFTHFWSMMTWGKKAGAWGQGVGGLKDRKRGP